MGEHGAVLAWRFPDWAMSSLEAYGVNVSELAVQCGMYSAACAISTGKIR